MKGRGCVRGGPQVGSTTIKEHKDGAKRLRMPRVSQLTPAIIPDSVRLGVGTDNSATKCLFVSSTLRLTPCTLETRCLESWQKYVSEKCLLMDICLYHSYTCDGVLWQVVPEKNSIPVLSGVSKLRWQ